MTKVKRLTFGLVLFTLFTSIHTASSSSADTTGTACVSTETSATPAATVYFPNASSALNQKSMSDLESLATSLQGKKDVTLQVTGYVSKTGPKSIYNSLAKSRAMIVEKYLASKGIKVKFVTKGVGLTADQSSSASARKTSIEVISQTQTTTGSAPVIKTLTSSLKFEVGTKVSIQVVDVSNSTGGPLAFKFSPELPAGVTFDPATGMISGTPKTSQTLQNMTITASNSCGTSDPVSIATTIAPAFVGGGPSLDPRSIWINPTSYENYYVLEEESSSPAELNATITDFNTTGVTVEYVNPPNDVVKSPILTISGNSNGTASVLGSGAVTYRGLGACSVDNATQRPVFTSLGACNIYAEIAMDGNYWGATSPTIVINLVASCADDPSAINCRLVTFDKNAEDAVFAENAVTSLYAYAGQDLTTVLPTVTRDGYTFAGWATGADLTLPITPVVGGSADITYYAVWTAIAP
jgi:uncharacterized repeat protein (TIGR02543 family)